MAEQDVEEEENKEDRDTDEAPRNDADGERAEGDDASGEELEPWHVWAQRVTHIALDEMRKAQVEDWGEAVRRKIWVLAGHISRRTDGRWSAEMLEWRPEIGERKVGHQEKRWSDDIERVTAELLGNDWRGEWRIAAANRDEWKRMEEQWMQALGRGEGYAPMKS